MTLCQRHGQSGVLVVDDGKLVGSVGREDLDRAIGHGLSHAPVKGIMSGRACPRMRQTRASSCSACSRSPTRGGSRSSTGTVSRASSPQDVLRALEAAEPAPRQRVDRVRAARREPCSRSSRPSRRRARPWKASTRRRHRPGHPHRRAGLRRRHRGRGRRDRARPQDRARAGRAHA